MLEQFRAAVAGAHARQVDDLGRMIWRAHGSALLSDADAQSLAEALQARQRALGSRVVPSSIRLANGRPCRSVPRSPDRERSICRRRSVSMSGALPSRLASAFTTGEAAVLSIIAGEVKRAGTCDWPVDKIAGLAGVSRRSAQYALRHAERLGMISITARPRPGLKNETNIIAIICADWRSWLKLHRVQKTACHGNNLIKQGRNAWVNNSGGKNNHRPASVTLHERLSERARPTAPPS